MLDRYNITIQSLSHFLRVAIGTEEVSVTPHKLSSEEWQQVYDMARKQGVLALAFDGMMRLFEQDQELAMSLPQPLKLRWISAVCNIESRYDYSRQVCAELAERWAEQGIRTLCLKGMAFSTLYPIPNHRECGDFDCYLFDDYAKGNAIARELGAKVDDGWYKHSEILYRKVMVENHQYIVAVRNGERERRLHSMLNAMATPEECEYLFGSKIEMPSPMFNAIFLNHHSLTHFLSEGIRLRHILDWALFIKEEQNRLDWRRFYEVCEEFKLQAFVDCATNIAVKLFNIEITNPNIRVESSYTERVLDSILFEDNAVFSQSVGAWRRRMMLVRNLFTSRWKYRAFSTQGVIAKFASLVWGFFTHPEEE